jgi:hypothetical protein
MVYRLSIAIALILALGVASYAAEEDPSPGESLYRRAFESGLELAERVELLERVVKEHPDSRWADDALWVLGESARQRGRPRLVVYYWQYLLVSRPQVGLEDFTLGQPVYRDSRLHQIRLFARMTGSTYSRDQEVRGGERRDEHVYINARPFDPVPVAVWEGLGHAYRHMRKSKMAARAYRMARMAAPERGLWAQRYREGLRHLEELVAQSAPPARAATHKEPAEASPSRPAGPSPGSAGRQPPAPAAGGVDRSEGA